MRAYGLTADGHAVGLRVPADMPVDQARAAIQALRDTAARLGYRVRGLLAHEPAPTREQTRHRDALARLDEQHGDIGEFAHSMTTHLPGVWTVDLPVMDTGFRQLDVTDRIWDEGHLAWIAAELVVDRAAILSGPSATELVVIDRAYGSRPFMVGAVLPPGSGRLPPHRPPHAISVPADPARAAERVVRRLLPDYRRAVAATVPALRAPATHAASAQPKPAARAR